MKPGALERSGVTMRLVFLIIGMLVLGATAAAPAEAACHPFCVADIVTPCHPACSAVEAADEAIGIVLDACRPHC